MEPPGVPLVTTNGHVSIPLIRSLWDVPLISVATARVIFHGTRFFLNVSIVIGLEREGKAFRRSIYSAKPGTFKIRVAESMKVCTAKIASMVPVPALNPNCIRPVPLLISDHLPK
jgi:hypothetical protein